MPRSASLARRIEAVAGLAGARPAAWVSRLAAFVGAALIVAGVALVPASAAAAASPTMTTRGLVQGHMRLGSWMAIEVNLANDGPDVIGELELAGATGRTRYSLPVDLPTTSAKRFVLYAQAPVFGGDLQVDLVADGHTITSAKVAYTQHNAGQLIVGVVAERPQAVVPDINLLPAIDGTAAAIVPLSPRDLPERVEGWAALDRLIWQDVDSNQLSTAQVAAMRGWLAGGGRLIIAGGTAGPSVLSAFPDDLLPYRPSATIDVAPQAIGGIIGELPASATDLPALGGALARGRALATSGDRAVVAEAGYGSGAVTIIGFDPEASWVHAANRSQVIWRRFLPPRSGGAVITGDDRQVVDAVQAQPALALPPVGGLLALLFGYILLIGPINYLILRRLDRREWAWITMPVLIAVFAFSAYTFGAALRGADVIVNEVAIVRGAPDAPEGDAQVYLGVFSPSRGTYQLEFPGGALLSSTLSGDFAGTSSSLDVVQGDPARVRNLAVGFGSLRTLRAESATSVPVVHAELSLSDGFLRGSVRNDSDQTLEKPAIVLGSSVIVLDDLKAHSQQTVSLPIRANQFGQSLSERILGTIFFGDPTGTVNSNQQSIVRHAILDQLSIDPSGAPAFGLPSEGPVLLAWGTRQVLDVRISGQEPKRTGNVLYYIPLGMRVQGTVSFEADLVRSSVVDGQALILSKDPSTIQIGRGAVTIAYRPIAFDGTFSPTAVTFGLNFGPELGTGGGAVKVEPANPQPCRNDGSDKPGCATPAPAPSCDPSLGDCSGAGGNVIDAVPEIEVFDRRGAGSWQRLPQLAMGRTYDLAHPERFVDPQSGTLLVRFVNDRQDSAGFGFQVRIAGTVK